MGELVERVDEHDQVLAVVDRAEAIRQGWLHRIATIVCRDTDGRFLVHRRLDDASRFPGQFNWMLGGAAEVGESYEEAAARELEEELGVSAAPRLVLKFLCAGAISPYWLGLHEVTVSTPIAPDPREVAWHDWLTEPELEDLVRRQEFVPDAREAFDRCRDLRRADRPLSQPHEARGSLRTATADDADFLTDMLVAAVNWDPARQAVSRDRVLMDRRLAHYVEGWPRVGDLGVVAVGEDGRPVGAAWLRLFSRDDPGYGFVSEDVPEVSVGVLPLWRGQGVGRALLAEVARRAAERGFARICLSVERANRARRLYASEGFTTVESGPASDTMIMVLSGR